MNNQNPAQTQAQNPPQNPAQPWYEPAYSNAKNWLQKPDVRKIFSTIGIVICAFGFVIYHIFRSPLDENPNDLQTIVQRIILAGQHFLMN